MTMIHLPGVRHLTSADVDAEVGEVGALGGSLTDAAAATIASWYQSPGTTGRYLAALASGVAVPADELIDDLDRTLREVTRDLPLRERHEHETNLGLLRAWAEGKL